jgi:hypothetical protein
VTVSITRLRLRSPRFLLPFIAYALLSERQARRAAGNLAADVTRDSHGAYWTRTVWRDNQSMRAFMMSGMHRRAMPKLLDWCDEAALVHWEQDSATPPDWQEAHHRLVTQGRQSKVRHPSPEQETLHFPAPGKA